MTKDIELREFTSAPDWNRETDPILEIKDLHLNFGVYEGVAKVLNGVDLAVDSGENVGLVGETGCGKSVTGRTILGILDDNAIIDQGEIFYKGHNLLELNEKELQKLRGTEIGLIPQDPMSALNPVFTIEEQLVDLIYSQYRGDIGMIEYFKDKFYSAKTERKKIRDDIKEMLDTMLIDDPERVMNSYPHELSGGMRQRVLIAAALVGDPEFLIADEIGTALDVTVEDSILELLEERLDQEQLSAVYITHDLGVARNFNERIYVMYAGEIIETAPTEQIFEDPLHPYTAGLIGAVPKLEGQTPRGIEGMIPDYVTPPGGCRYHPRCPFAMPACDTDDPPLRPPEMLEEFEVEGENPHKVSCHLYDSRYEDDHPEGWSEDLTIMTGLPDLERTNIPDAADHNGEQSEESSGRVSGGGST